MKATFAFDILFQKFCNSHVEGFSDGDCDYMYEIFNDVKYYNLVQTCDNVINNSDEEMERLLIKNGILSKLKSINKKISSSGVVKDVATLDGLKKKLKSRHFDTVVDKYLGVTENNEMEGNHEGIVDVQEVEENTKFDYNYQTSTGVISNNTVPNIDDNQQYNNGIVPSYTSPDESEVFNTFNNTDTSYSGPNGSLYKTVILHRREREPLGFTVMQEKMDVIVSRIIMDSPIEKQKLLRLGDVIVKVNNRPITSAQQVRDLILYSGSDSTIKLTIVPFSVAVKYLPAKSSSLARLSESSGGDFEGDSFYVKAYFDYSSRDSPGLYDKCPCEDLNMSFTRGEILKVIRKDGNWWQSVRLETGKEGIIPSHQLQEKYENEYDQDEKSTSVSFISSFTCGLVSPKKKKNGQNRHKRLKKQEATPSDLNMAIPQDIATYENVVQVAGFKRRVVVLVGPKGIGRRTLKSRLLKCEPEKYSAVIATTSRPPRPDEIDGEIFQFETTENMQSEIQNGGFVEWGKYDGHYYGTSFHVINTILDSNTNLSVVMDLSPQVLKQIRTAKYKPLVIFIAAPNLDKLRSMYKEAYADGKTNRLFSETDLQNTVKESRILDKHYYRYFDVILKNEGLDECYYDLKNVIENASCNPVWIPTNWNRKVSSIYN